MLWERKFSSQRQERLRDRRLVPLLVSLVVIFSLLLNSWPVLAAWDGKFSFDGQSVVYQEHGILGDGLILNLNGPKTAEANDGLELTPGTSYFSYIKASNDPKQAEVLILSVDNADQPQNGQFISYHYDANTKRFSDKQIHKNNVVIDTSTERARRNCNIGWIGFIVCPIINGLADFVDGAYGIVSDLLKTRPIDVGGFDELGREKPIYAVWATVRNISNITFIIAFLIIILSHLTGFGLSSYHIKKIFPRLIVAALLVNLSLYACAIAVDLTNLIGYSINDFFTSILTRTMPDGPLSSINSWTELISVTLGGAVAGGAIVTFSGGIVVIGLVILIGLVAALCVIAGVLLALTARQAIIIILVTIAPLAMVANILPNTEKYFKQWLNMFAKVLLLFPSFALIYGGSKLASGLILQSANGNFLLIFMGLVLRVVPFALLFSQIKNSNDWLDKIASWTHDQANKRFGKPVSDLLRQEKDIRKAQYLSGQKPHYDNKVRQAMSNLRPRNMARSFELSRRATEERLKIANTQLDNTFSEAKAQVDVKLTKNKGDLSAFRAGSAELALARNSLRRQIENERSKSMEYLQIANTNKRTIENNVLPKSLGYGQNIKLHDAMAGSNEDYKGYILSQVIATGRKEKQEAMDRAEALINHLNISEEEKIALAVHDGFGNGEAFRRHQTEGGIRRRDAQGDEYFLDFDDKIIRAAAARMMGRIPRVDIHEALQLATIDGGVLSDEREMVSAAIHSSGVGANTMMGIKTYDYMVRQLFRGVDTYYEIELENIAKGRYSTDSIIKHDKDALDRMLKGLELMVDPRTGSRGSIQLANPDINGNVITTDMIDHLINLSGDRQTAHQNLETFKNVLQDTLNNPLVRQSLKSIQIQKIEAMINHLSPILQKF